MVEEFIKDICEELAIDVPEISYDTSLFPSKTMRAMCDGETIYLRMDGKKPSLDLFLSITHEMRHLWQIKYHEELFFKDYITADKAGDIEEYNMQLAELDANAYASLIMVDEFGIQPLFQGLPDKVRKAIYSRVNYIVDNELY